MRLSTNAIFQSNTNRMMDMQSQVSRLNQQISTGKRITSPADDPVASARLLELNRAKETNANYAATRKTAETTLQTYEANLSSVTETVQTIQSALLAAGNGGYSDQQRAGIANELQGKLDTLLGLANARNGQGNYLYSGYHADTAAFSNTGTFQGDTSRLNLQIESQSQMATTFTGDQVFQANGNDVFATLQSMISLLNTPITDATTQSNFQTGLKDSLTKMQGVLDQVLNTRAEIGSKLNQLDTLNTAGDDVDLQYTTAISSLQDLDYTQALSDLSKHSTILEAAQKAFVSTSQLSLFKLI